jgi:hypothetical protein
MKAFPDCLFDCQLILTGGHAPFSTNYFQYVMNNERDLQQIYSAKRVHLRQSE